MPVKLHVESAHRATVGIKQSIVGVRSAHPFVLNGEPLIAQQPPDLRIEVLLGQGAQKHLSDASFSLADSLGAEGLMSRASRTDRRHGRPLPTF